MTLHEELTTALSRICRINVRYMGDTESADAITERAEPLIEKVRTGIATKRDLGALCALGLVHEANLYGANIPAIIGKMFNQMKAEMVYENSV